MCLSAWYRWDKLDSITSSHTHTVMYGKTVLHYHTVTLCVCSLTHLQPPSWHADLPYVPHPALQVGVVSHAPTATPATQTATKSRTSCSPADAATPTQNTMPYTMQYWVPCYGRCHHVKRLKFGEMLMMQRQQCPAGAYSPEDACIDSIEPYNGGEQPQVSLSKPGSSSSGNSIIRDHQQRWQRANSSLSNEKSTELTPRCRLLRNHRTPVCSKSIRRAPSAWAAKRWVAADTGMCTIESSCMIRRTLPPPHTHKETLSGPKSHTVCPATSLVSEQEPCFAQLPVQCRQQVVHFPHSCVVCRL